MLRAPRKLRIGFSTTSPLGTPVHAVSPARITGVVLVVAAAGLMQVAADACSYCRRLRATAYSQLVALAPPASG